MNAQLKRHPCLRLLDVTQAFAAFCGKPLKSLDAAAVLDESDLAVIENSLRRMAGYLSTVTLKDQAAQAGIRALVAEVRRHVRGEVSQEPGANAIEPHCPRCGSSNVAHDAVASWNYKRQEWQIETLVESCGGFCLACESIQMDLPFRAAPPAAAAAPALTLDGGAS